MGNSSAPGDHSERLAPPEGNRNTHCEHLATEALIPPSNLTTKCFSLNLMFDVNDISRVKWHTSLLLHTCAVYPVCTTTHGHTQG